MIKKLLARYTRLSKREKQILYGTALVLGLLFTDRIIVGPVVYKMIQLDRQIQTEEAAIKKSLHILLRKDQIIEDGKKLTAYMVRSQDKEREMTHLLRELENIANRSKVNLVYVKPGSTQESQGMIRHLATLECEAQMPEVATFFHHIEGSDLLLKVEKYEIQPRSRDSSIARCVMTISKTSMPMPET